jgi:RsiW-degrading membrane proteinase PrsW (M82 family)
MSHQPSTSPDEPESVVKRVPRWLVLVDVGYLVLLGSLALWWGQSPWLRSHFPLASSGVPVEVLWWGALGAVTVSLAATTKFRDTWDDSLNAWHVARPATGAVLGGVSYLIYVLVIATAGATRTHPSSGELTFYLVAFLVGYREETFRQLINRATDAILGPDHTSEDRPSRRRRREAENQTAGE